MFREVKKKIQKHKQLTAKVKPDGQTERQTGLLRERQGARWR